MLVLLAKKLTAATTTTTTCFLASPCHTPATRRCSLSLFDQNDNKVPTSETASTATTTTTSSSDDERLAELQAKCPSCVVDSTNRNSKNDTPLFVDATVAKTMSKLSNAAPFPATGTAVAAANEDNKKDVLLQDRRKNLIVAGSAVSAALLQYAWRFQHPTTALELLVQMAQDSPPLSRIGHNDRPTVVEFWAPWCEVCQESAPTMAAFQRVWKDQVDFISINGASPANAALVRRWGVDAIPHVAFVSREGDVLTALIGRIPQSVLTANVQALLQSERQLPYSMYDAFAQVPELRRVAL